MEAAFYNNIRMTDVDYSKIAAASASRFSISV